MVGYLPIQAVLILQKTRVAWSSDGKFRKKINRWLRSVRYQDKVFLWRESLKENGKWLRPVFYRDKVFLGSIYLDTLVYHQSSVVNSNVSSFAAVFMTYQKSRRIQDFNIVHSVHCKSSSHFNTQLNLIPSLWRRKRYISPKRRYQLLILHCAKNPYHHRLKHQTWNHKKKPTACEWVPPSMYPVSAPHHLQHNSIQQTTTVLWVWHRTVRKVTVSVLNESTAFPIGVTYSYTQYGPATCLTPDYTNLWPRCERLVPRKPLKHCIHWSSYVFGRLRKIAKGDR
jgi:hypothetical protein